MGGPTIKKLSFTKISVSIEKYNRMKINETRRHGKAGFMTFLKLGVLHSIERWRIDGKELRSIWILKRTSEKERWCRRGDLNPHGGYPPPPQDGVSTNSTTSASLSVKFISSARVQAPGAEPGVLKARQEPSEPAFPS